MRITSSCMFFNTSCARAESGGSSGSGGRLSLSPELSLPLSDVVEFGFDGDVDLAAARDAHHIRSIRRRSESGKLASMCL
jgi:hypothetical protein